SNVAASSPSSCQSRSAWAGSSLPRTTIARMIVSQECRIAPGFARLSRMRSREGRGFSQGPARKAVWENASRGRHLVTPRRKRAFAPRAAGGPSRGYPFILEHEIILARDIRRLQSQKGGDGDRR